MVFRRQANAGKSWPVSFLGLVSLGGWSPFVQELSPLGRGGCYMETQCSPDAFRQTGKEQVSWDLHLIYH
ncbi:hypothetical protein DM01DRAFT_1331853 [Hesseltinella vesiculosa]|uniref:Uncharacterized protein n=1 Tax=Hesseltinella vesiculosa TaxID=101127 RepID=A0A1X2GWQ8_9FUNG|nr:hypothetical protein DM01DRAFT_1331853 [Hesseltinella vesiculosa]